MNGRPSFWSSQSGWRSRSGHCLKQRGNWSSGTFPIVALLQLPEGEGPVFVRKHSFTYDGNFPLNTSGGQLSVGQAGAAGGFLGMVEAIRQLTGEAGERTVKGAKLGLVSGFGMINYDRGLGSGAAILAKA